MTQPFGACFRSASRPPGIRSFPRFEIIGRRRARPTLRTLSLHRAVVVISGTRHIATSSMVKLSTRACAALDLVLERLAQLRKIDRLDASRRTGIGLGLKFAAIPRSKHEGNLFPRQHVGNRVDPLVSQINVENRSLYFARVNQAKRISNGTGGAHNLRSKILKKFGHIPRQKIFVLDDQQPSAAQQLSRPIHLSRSNGISTEQRTPSAASSKLVTASS